MNSDSFPYVFEEQRYSTSLTTSVSDCGLGGVARPPELIKDIKEGKTSGK